MKKRKGNILFIPAWYPCSFFEEQQKVYTDNYNIYNLLGSCSWLSKKTQIRQLIALKRASCVNVNIKENCCSADISCPKYNSPAITDKAIRTVSNKLGCILSKWIGDQKWDYIYIQSISDLAVFAADWARNNGIKIILAEHILYIRHSCDYITQKREQLYQIADKILCVSNYLYRNLLTNGFKMKSVSIIGNLVNEHGIPTQWKDLRKNGRIMFVATHLADKDIATLFDVAARMKEKELKIDIFGLEGSELYARNETIAQHISNIGLLDVITIKGKLSHDILLEKYSQYSVLLSTSISETFGLAVAEAIAHGTPVVCTDSGGIHDFVNEKNGIVVPIKDANRISEAILEVIQIPYEYEKMSQFIIHKYGIDSYKKTNYHYLGVHGD